MGGKFHPKLNMCVRPIANKYHEGKMKRTLERELKVSEIAEKEAHGTSAVWRDCCTVGLHFVDAAQAQLRSENLSCVMLLALCVSHSTLTKRTPGTCKLAFGVANVPGSICVCVGS